MTPRKPEGAERAPRRKAKARKRDEDLYPLPPVQAFIASGTPAPPPSRWRTLIGELRHAWHRVTFRKCFCRVTTICIGPPPGVNEARLYAKLSGLSADIERALNDHRSAVLREDYERRARENIEKMTRLDLKIGDFEARERAAEDSR